MNYYIDVLKQYAVFTGRSGRKEYWMFFLFNIVISIVLGIIDTFIGTGGLIQGVYGLAILCPSLGLSMRRLHDIGKSGWWVLIGLVPFVGAIVLIIFAVMDGQPGSNQYGPNPKEGAIA